MRNTLLAVVFFALSSAAAGSVAAPPAALVATVTARPVGVGDTIAGRVFENDRIEWKLPAKRLESFRKAGVVITEEHHITRLVSGAVIAAGPSGSVVRVSVHQVSYDVPRATTTVADQTYTARLGTNNEPTALGDLDVAGAALVGLPLRPGASERIGRGWRSRVAVLTELGSGTVTFDHALVGVHNGLVEISVSGTGAITGAQYHLPKLLPGSIQMHGTAWYELRSGIITQESYFIRNRLLKPAAGEQIGFDERLTVDASRSLSRSARSRAGEE